jgi:hypothetical protein
LVSGCAIAEPAVTASIAAAAIRIFLLFMLLSLETLGFCHASPAGLAGESRQRDLSA